MFKYDANIQKYTIRYILSGKVYSDKYLAYRFWL